MIRKNIHHASSGFTLLFASIVVSLILSIGLAIAHLTLTQLILSSAGRESQTAFYNADSGIECALFQAQQVRGDGISPWFSSSDDTSPYLDFECFGEAAYYTDIRRTGATTTTTFYVNPPDLIGVGMSTGLDDEECFKEKPTFQVKVHRHLRPSGLLTDMYIESRGYNTCDEANPRRVERGLYVRTVE